MNPDDSLALAVQVGKIEQKLDNSDSKLDAVHASLKEDIGKVEQQTRAHNGRMTGLEKRQSELKGIGVALLALSPFVLFALQKLTS